MSFDFTSIFTSPTLPDASEPLAEDTRHGWYSAKQAQRCSRIVYKTADQGSTVMVTNVTNSLDHGMGWDDVIYVGRIYTGPGGFVCAYPAEGYNFETELKNYSFEKGLKDYSFDASLGKSFKIKP